MPGIHEFLVAATLILFALGIFWAPAKANLVSAGLLAGTLAFLIH